MALSKPASLASAAGSMPAIITGMGIVREKLGSVPASQKTVSPLHVIVLPS
jgi:hypothetical protein